MGSDFSRFRSSASSASSFAAFLLRVLIKEGYWNNFITLFSQIFPASVTSTLVRRILETNCRV